MMRDLFELPERPAKPRDKGLTMVIDSGLPVEAFKQYIDLGHCFIDYVKFGWGTSVITSEAIKEKVRIAKETDVLTCFGGTLFEFAYMQDKVDELLNLTECHDVDMIEISDGSIDITRDSKLRFIKKFSRKTKVLSEFGSKDAEEVMAPSLWVIGMTEELEAGAWKVIAEGRESGTAGLYRKDQEIRTGLVDEIVADIDGENVIWEAPKKAQQVWFIKKFGSNVNLGNIAPGDVVALETLRLGLRGDTLQEFHGAACDH